jgi:lipid II isoglutaminyl synthase (glutamine-hydrolysing)
MRQSLAILSARVCIDLLKFFKLGNGSSLPGRVALKLSPKLLRKADADIHCKQDALKVMVSGTNGKTTSVGLIDSIYEVTQNKENLISNRLGANLYYGVATAFCNFRGDFAKADFILEVDEAALKTVIKDIKPNFLAFTNIFRDQLDRFGEIDATKNLLEEALRIADLEDDFNLILNYDDIKLRSITTKTNDNIYFFRLITDEALKLNSEKVLDKDISFFDDACLDQAPSKIKSTLINKAKLITGKLKILETKYSVFDLIFRDESIEVTLNLPGLYNVYNALLAASVFLAAGNSLDKVAQGLTLYRGAFGRSQTIDIKGIESNIYLIKNPKGCSEVLNMVKNDKNSLYLIIINDNYADGRDVSWLWDADFEALVNECHKNNKNARNEVLHEPLNYVCSGKRAYDMALRLKYAGAKTHEIYVEEDIQTAIDFASNYINKKEYTDSSSIEGKAQIKNSLNILPTYTALLDLEKKLNLTTSPLEISPHLHH